MAAQGSVRAKGRGRWEMRIAVGKGAERRNLSRTVHVETEWQARAALTRWRRELGREREGTRVTMGELLEAHYERTLKRRTARSNDNVRRYLDRYLLPAFGDRRVSQLGVEEIERYYAEVALERSPALLRQLHAVMRPALALACRWEWIDRNPADDVELDEIAPLQAKALPVPSDADVERLLTAAAAWNPGMGLFIRLAAITGCRRGELSALRWEDISWLGPRGGSIHIRRSLTEPKSGMAEKTTKTGRQRVVDVDVATLAALERVRAWNVERGAGDGPARWVFPDLDRDAVGALPYGPGRWSQWFKKLRAKTGVTCRLHDLRHWNASGLLESGEISIKEVQEHTGHSRAATLLEVYGHVIERKTRSSDIIVRRLNE